MKLDDGFNILPPWALEVRAKTAIPELPAGHVRRKSLVRQLDSLLERRLTVLWAPAGFGKTTLLADACREKRKEAVVAWLALDDCDRPGELASCLACAFGRAGMDLTALQECGGWSSLHNAQQMGMLARAVALHAAPCLLVLDNMDRLQPCSADWLDRLVKRGPRNLHVAVACRSTPRINLTGHELDGSVSIIETKQLRWDSTRVSLARVCCAASRRQCEPGLLSLPSAMQPCGARHQQQRQECSEGAATTSGRERRSPGGTPASQPTSRGACLVRPQPCRRWTPRRPFRFATAVCRCDRGHRPQGPSPTATCKCRLPPNSCLGCRRSRQL